MPMERNKSIFSSFKRAFRSTANSKDSKSPVSKRKDGRSVPRKGLVFPENSDKRYEDFTHQEDGKRTTTVQKQTRKPMHTLSQRSHKERPALPMRNAADHQPQRINNKSATLPSSMKPPSSHAIRIPPPRHTRKPIPSSPDHYYITPVPSSSSRGTGHLPISVGTRPTHPHHSPSLLTPYTMSCLDVSNSQYKTPVNISRTGPTTLPHDYSEPFHWLAVTDTPPTSTSAHDHQYTIIPNCNDKRTRLHSEYNESSADETEHKYANLLVSSSMVELRSNHDYMEIDRLTLDRPTVASDYQQPIALRRLPGPPTAVKERQQRRDETRILRGTIVVLDENKTLEV